MEMDARQNSGEKLDQTTDNEDRLERELRLQHELSLNYDPVRLSFPDGKLLLHRCNWWTENAERPVILMIHGAFRRAARLGPLGILLRETADVIIVDLPGHGGSDVFSPASIEGWAKRLSTLVTVSLDSRHVIFVGESLGGLIGIALGGKDRPRPLKRIVALDPPLTTAKQWPILNNIFRLREKNPRPDIKEIIEQIFGVSPTDELHEKNYYSLLENIQTPLHIALGSDSMHPMRIVDRPPSLVDDVDRYVLQNIFGDKVKMTEIPNTGHLISEEARDYVANIIFDEIRLMQTPPQ